MRLHGILICFLLATTMSVVAADETVMNVFVDRKCGRINQALAGVSQGGNAGSYLKDGTRTGMKDLPVRIVRLEMVTGSHIYGLYNPVTKVWNWEKLDREIENIKGSGAEVMINLFGTPSWMSTAPKAKVPAFAPPRDYREYADYCAAIVRHVNLEKHYGIKYWEIWNEPSGNYFWTGWKQGKETFFELYAVTAKAIKAADPAIKVGGFADNAYYLEHYRDFFAYAKSHNAPIDFLTIHWYGDWHQDGWRHPEWFDSFAEKAMALYRKSFGHEVPLFYSEWNLIAESKGKYQASQVAAYAASALCRMQQNNKLSGAMFFRIEPYRDPCSSLLDRGNRTKAPWRILKMFTMLPETRLQTTCDAPDITLLAGGDREKVSAMIVRYDVDGKPECKNLHLDFSGLIPGSSYLMRLCREDETTAGQTGTLTWQAEKMLVADAKGTARYLLPLNQYAVVMATLAYVKP